MTTATPGSMPRWEYVAPPGKMAAGSSKDSEAEKWTTRGASGLHSFLRANTTYLSAEPRASWERQNTPAGRSPAQQLQPTWYPHSTEEEGASALILSAGQELSGIEIRLIRGGVHKITGKITGLVVGIQGLRPTSTADLYAQPRVSAMLLSGAVANSYPGDLRDDGSFEVQGVPSGVYDVKVQQGMMPILGLGRVRVRVTDQDVEGVLVVVLPPGPLPGIIRIEGDAPLPPSAISVRLDSLNDTIGLLPAHHTGGRYF
jgi:hypothetical protein